MGLAAKHQLGGLILHSPMLSGIRVIDPDPDRCCRPSCVYHCFDFFPNGKRVKSITCPVFIIHGQLDEIIPFYHGERMSEATPRQFRWPGFFPKKAGHNDIVETNSQAYYGEVSMFLNMVSRRANGEEVGFPVRKPDQVSMDGQSVKEFSERRFPEPIVGPEDGRYEHLRRPGGAGKPGAARDLQPVPFGSAS